MASNPETKNAFLFNILITKAEMSPTPEFGKKDYIKLILEGQNLWETVAKLKGPKLLWTGQPLAAFSCDLSKDPNFCVALVKTGGGLLSKTQDITAKQYMSFKPVIDSIPEKGNTQKIRLYLQDAKNGESTGISLDIVFTMTDVTKSSHCSKPKEVQTSVC